MRRTVKRTGCSLPFHPLQILGWVLFVIDVAVPCTCTLPLFTPSMRIGCGVCFGLAVLAVVVATAALTLSDPSDYTGHSVRRSVACETCKCRVDASSKHCMRCNRCVVDFDHHCKWVNNCVGRSNYRLFLKLLLATSLFCLMVLVQAGVVLFSAWQDYAAFQRSVEDLYGDVADVVFGVLLGTAAECLLLLILLVYLQCFHAWLARQQLTTFEYLLQRGRRRLREQPTVSPTVPPVDIVLDESPDSVLYKPEQSTVIQV